MTVAQKLHAISILAFSVSLPEMDAYNVAEEGLDSTSAILRAIHGKISALTHAATSVKVAQYSFHSPRAHAATQPPGRRDPRKAFFALHKTNETMTAGY